MIGKFVVLNQSGEIMYGYFRPRNSHLSEDELNIFNGYYCRVCYCLRDIGGQPARFFTTYDMAVYSIILNMQQKHPRPEHYRCERIATKVMHSFDDDVIGHRLAAMTVILFGEVIRDHRIDGECIKAGTMDILFHNTVIKACQDEPEMADIARKGTEKINKLQNDNGDLMDILNAYGNMVVTLFRCICDIEEPYAEAIQRIAEWCFYIDMLYDYDDDYKSGSYNGFKAEGIRTIKDCFNSRYPEMIKVNTEITSPLKEAIYNLNENSIEAHIILKLIDTAFGWTIWKLLCSRQERRAMFKAAPHSCLVHKIPAK